MHPSTLIYAVIICVLNAFFMVTGIILNSVVIITLWRSSQLRKKLCYFMILVLSCFDLPEVIIGHPLLILSTILWSVQINHREITRIRKYTFILLSGFSMLALLTLNIERFLALTRPYFHQTAVTKGKLALFLALQIIIVVALTLLYFFGPKTIVYRPIILTVFALTVSLVLSFLNYKMLVIVRSKRDGELRVDPTALIPAHQERNKNRKRNLRNFSTCSLVVGCFFASSFPGIVFCIWIFITKSSRDDSQVRLFDIFASTFVCMNSTFNCLIFFWRHSILRREGIKIVKC